MINIEKAPKTKRKNTTNFDGRLVMHKIKYTISPGDWNAENDKVAWIIADSYKEAEKLVVDSIPKDLDFVIDEMSDSVLEISAISEPVKQRLYDMFKPQFENKKVKLADRLRDI
jgi:hypothetical protein